MHPTHNESVKKSDGGFSLVELVFAVAIFGFLGLTISSTALYSRIQAEKNIYGNMAATATLGYAEQIKNMTYAKVQACVNDSTVPLPAVSVESVLTGNFGSLDDPLLTGPNNVNVKQVLIDIEYPNTPNEKRIMMDYEMMVLLNDLSKVN